MIELLTVWLVGSRLAGIAAAKGHPKKWGLLAVAGWLVGEFLGLVVGFAIGLPTLGAYALALLSAAALTWSSFKYVRSLPNFAGATTRCIARNSYTSCSSKAPRPAWGA